VKRREFIALLGGAAVSAWPFAAQAQQAERMRRIGVLTLYTEGDAEGQALFAVFRETLEKLGWATGSNIMFDYRWGAGDSNRLPALAAELVSAKPDVIVVRGTPGTEALQQATRTIPIVFMEASDPVGTGFIESLARPGGNITGFSNFEFSIAEKWLELLKEIAPGVTRTLVTLLPGNGGNLGLLRAIEAAAPSLRVQVIPAAVSDASEIERAITAFAGEPNGGLLVLPSTPLRASRELIAALAVRLRLPAVYPDHTFITSGGLMSYGIEDTDNFRRSASYVDRILRGEKPADLPVQQPTKFKLVINLKTAKTIGLNVPPTLLVRADEVIE
jgi:putative ABC transport system substrate-binding protein